MLWTYPTVTLLPLAGRGKHRRMLSFLALFLLAMFEVTPAVCAPPAVFYTDLTSGPNTGGEANLGTILTISGKHFGEKQSNSKVTIGGGSVARYLTWSDGRIAVAIGDLAATGPVAVTVNGVSSNTDVTFTVRRGKIYCVSSTSGSDSNNGQFPSAPGRGNGCWQHARHAKAHLRAGDIAYFGSSPADHFQSENGRDPCGIGGYTGFLLSTACPGVSDGTPDRPIAIVGYPGAVAVFGGPGPDYAENGIGTPNSVHAVKNWTISNVTAIAGPWMGKPGWAGILLERVEGIRVVNCDIQAPFHYQFSALNIDHTGSPTSGITIRLYGNKIHNFHTSTDAPYHHWKHSVGVYFTGDANEIDFAWNDIDGGGYRTSKCLHIHSSPFGSKPPDGYPQYGIHIHDNYCHDAPASAIDINLIDPGKGTGFELYNNLFANVGHCAQWVGDITSFSGISFLNYGDQRWASQSGTVRIFNNTFYSAGGCPLEPSGIIYVAKPPSGWGKFGVGIPPNDGAPVTICSGACENSTWSGVLPRGPYYPNHVGITIDESANSPAQVVVDEGSGHLLENQAVIGTIDYASGRYEFTLTRPPGARSNITAYTILGYKILLENNVFYQLSSAEKYISPLSSALQLTHLSGSHNLFYTVGGQTVPPQFTNNVGSNTDPLFVNMAANDFHLQAASIARNAGTTSVAGHDRDGIERPAGRPADLGAYQYSPM
jgi:hypothetical protein